MFDKGYKSATMKTYISAIKRVLMDDGYAWNNSIVLFASLTKACRLQNDKVYTRFPIQFGLFELILFEISRVYSQPYLIALYRGIFTLAYYGLMRISELVVSPVTNHHVRAKDIHVGMNKNKILVVLYTSKTHGLESHPQKIKIHASEEDYNPSSKNFCPFNIMRRYMRIRGGFDIKTEPLFVFSDGSRVHADQVRRTLRICLSRLGLDPSLYDTHSFRIGMASDMLRQHQDLDRIKMAGRWHSNAVYKYLCSL